MTITPMPVLPAASRGSASRASDAKPGKAADDFAAVLDGHLNGTKTAREAAASKENASSPDASASEWVPAGDVQPSAVPPGGLTPVTVEPLGVVPVTTPATATSTPSGDAAADTIGAATVPMPASTATAAASTTHTPTGSTDPATPHQPTPTADAAPAPAETAPADAATPHQPAASTAPLPDLAVVTTVTKASAGKAPSAAVALEQAESSTATPAVGVAAPATPATEAPAAGPTQPTAPSPVLAQVTPALARVVTRGDGEHRMMLKLHPADLGEVHLTVTVRGDQVDVEIAAGPEAREVLRDGSAHLRSLLESIGRSTGQLVLRDLPATPTPAAGAAPGGASHDGGAGTSYADTGDGRRDQTDTRGGRQQPRPADQSPDRPLVTPRASGRTTVPGVSALDVTV